MTSRTFTVRFDAGTWYVSFQTERDVAETVHGKAGTIVGIDVGVARFAALSDGTFIEGANAFEKHKKRLAFLQRRLARTVKYSANWRKAKARITKIHSSIANIRKDRIHKASTTIGKNHAVVVMEDLWIANMTKSAAGSLGAPGNNVRAKAGLNRRILDQGWDELRRQPVYKLAWQSGTLLLVDPRDTSRTCSACGHVGADNRRTQSAFVCVACGHAVNADTNAATNILGRAGCARIACGDLPSESTKQEAQCAA